MVPSTQHTTPCNSLQTPPRPGCRQLSFGSTDISTPIGSESTPICIDSSDEEEEEEDFQMVPLDDNHWTAEEKPEKTFCVHEHGLPHGLCNSPCPYTNYLDSLDLSDISDYEEFFEDYMITSSDEDIPGMEGTPY